MRDVPLAFPPAPATWLLVRISPSGATTTPEPVPAREPPLGSPVWMVRPTTAGPTRSTTSITALEYASRSSRSSAGNSRVAEVPLPSRTASCKGMIFMGCQGVSQRPLGPASVPVGSIYGGGELTGKDHGKGLFG